MLVKKSRNNQVAIPKEVLRRAGLGPDDVYFLVEYRDGTILLRPVRIEERIPPEALERFKSRVLRGQAGDRSHRSMKALVRDLRRKG